MAERPPSCRRSGFFISGCPVGYDEEDRLTRSVLTPIIYYGGKSKLIHRYPAPKFPLIIEPFAGSAAYAFQWAGKEPHEVWVNDLDPITFSIWEFLTSPQAMSYYGLVPSAVAKGDHVSEMFSEPVPDGLLAWCRAEANQGTQGAHGVHDQVTALGAKCWHRSKSRLLTALDRVKGWTVTNRDYHDLPDIEATWFIDPPYLNAAGSRYRCGPEGIDYAELACWCQSRPGQVIVCENIGASWLPFEPLTASRRGVKSRYQTSNVGEAVWIKE